MRNRPRQTRALLPSGTSCRSEKPATYPRRPGRSRTVWTIPTVPCPSCQTASRRYAHSHRRAQNKHLLCQSGRMDLRIVADGLRQRPPPRNPPDEPPASRYSPAETTETANRHPPTHSATSPSCPPALQPAGSPASERLFSRMPGGRRTSCLPGVCFASRPIPCLRPRPHGPSSNRRGAQTKQEPARPLSSRRPTAPARVRVSPAGRSSFGSRRRGRSG